MDPEPGEEVFFHGHPSWRAMLAFYAKGLAISILAGAVAGIITAIASGHVEAGWVIAVVLAVFIVGLAVAQLGRLQTTYTITNQRLTIQTGLLSRELHETRLERVQNVNVRQSLPERMLRIGDVDFDTAAGAEYDFSFRGVGDPRRIVHTVDRALHELGAARAPRAQDL
ncbi:MAG TPA: PH domain-containing protein [Solirubrobacteraceae bacterium]